jgi:hypothetical protein
LLHAVVGYVTQYRNVPGKSNPAFGIRVAHRTLEFFSK